METYEGLLDGSLKGDEFRREIIPGDAENSPIEQTNRGEEKVARCHGVEARCQRKKLSLFAVG